MTRGHAGRRIAKLDTVQAQGIPALFMGLLVASFVLLLSAPTATAGERGQTAELTSDLTSEPMALGYRVYAGGLHALSLDARIKLAGSSYEVDFTARTDGFIARLFTLILTAEAEGERTDSGLRPRRFQTANRWQDNDERWVRLTYGDAPAPHAEAKPPPSEDDRDIVPESRRHGTVDPITAVFDLLGADGSPPCEGRAAVFDGRRRYDLEARRIGENGLRASRYNIYGGPALECRLIFRQIEGFWKKQRTQGRYPREMRVWLAKVRPEAPYVPVRIAAETRFAAIRIHLTRLEVPAGTALTFETDEAERQPKED